MMMKYLMAVLLMGMVAHLTSAKKDKNRLGSSNKLSKDEKKDCKEFYQNYLVSKVIMEKCDKAKWRDFPVYDLDDKKDFDDALDLVKDLAECWNLDTKDIKKKCITGEDGKDKGKVMAQFFNKLLNKNLRNWISDQPPSYEYKGYLIVDPQNVNDYENQIKNQCRRILNPDDDDFRVSLKIAATEDIVKPDTADDDSQKKLERELNNCGAPTEMISDSRAPMMMP